MPSYDCGEDNFLLECCEYLKLSEITADAVIPFYQGSNRLFNLMESKDQIHISLLPYTPRV